LAGDIAGRASSAMYETARDCHILVLLLTLPQNMTLLVTFSSKGHLQYYALQYKMKQIKHNPHSTAQILQYILFVGNEILIFHHDRRLHHYHW
jgi:hypothetical protein